MERIWEVLVAECDELGGVHWDWQAADGWLGKARFGGEKGGRKPDGSREKRHQEVGAGGRRRRAAGGGDRGANVPDCKMLRATIEAIVVERPEPTTKLPQHLCLDKGYDNPTGRRAAVDAKYIPHIRRIGEEKKPCDRSKGEKPRRWVVERTLAWLSKCRGILIRYDKKDVNYLGLIQLACALCWYRRLYRMGRCNGNQVPT